MAEHKTKSFGYWRARFISEPYDYKLHDLLLSAFDYTRVRDRLETFEEENEEMANHVHFINHKAIYEDFFCANLFGYEKGKIEQTIKEEFDNEEVNPAAHELPIDEQYLDGKLYFVCLGNHLIVSQDTRLKVPNLAKYLNSMFHERCSEFPEAQQLVIERTIKRTRREEIRGAKRINLSAPLPSGRSPSVGVDLESQRQSFSMDGRSLGDRVWDAIEILTGTSPEEIMQKFQPANNTQGIVDKTDIEVTLSLIWNRRQSGGRFSDQVDAFANAFSYIDDEIDVKIETHSGTLLNYDELVKSKKFCKIVAP